MYYCGYDPGVNKTSIVILDSFGKLVERIPVEVFLIDGYTNQKCIDILGTLSKLKKYTPLKMFSEKILSYGQGSKGSFTFGSAMTLLGNMQKLEGVDLVVLRPQDWKKRWNLSSDKKLSIEQAKQLGLTGKISHNLAESYLLAKLCYGFHTQRQNMIT